jgi:hypothetical protein
LAIVKYPSGTNRHRDPAKALYRDRAGDAIQTFAPGNAKIGQPMRDWRYYKSPRLDDLDLGAAGAPRTVGTAWRALFSSSAAGFEIRNDKLLCIAI